MIDDTSAVDETVDESVDTTEEVADTENDAVSLLKNLRKGAESEEETESEEEEKPAPKKEEGTKEKLSRADREFSALSRKKKQFAELRASVEEDKRQLEREKRVAASFLDERVNDITNYKRLQELAKTGDPDLIEALGLNLETLVTNYLERNTPEAAAKKAVSRAEQEYAKLRSELDAERADMAKQKQSAFVERENQLFVNFARDNKEAYPYVASEAEDNTDEVIKLAWQVKEISDQRGLNLKGEAILAEVNAYYENVAQRYVSKYSKNSSSNNESGLTGGTKKSPAKGLSKLSSKATAGQSSNPANMSQSDREKMARKLVSDFRRSAQSEDDDDLS